ncbi:hypothetical protein D3C87_2045370 [compost metagenome]
MAGLWDTCSQSSVVFNFMILAKGYRYWLNMMEIDSVVITVAYWMKTPDQHR